MIRTEIAKKHGQDKTRNGETQRGKVKKESGEQTRRTNINILSFPFSIIRTRNKKKQEINENKEVEQKTGKGMENKNK